MNRRRSLLSLLVFTFICVSLFSPLATADQSVPNSGPSRVDTPVEPLCVPTFVLPDDTVLVWCEAEQYCFDISASDADESDSLLLSLVSGPITYEPELFGYEFTTTVCFTPETSGDFTFVWQLEDRQQHVLVDTVTFTVELGFIPSIEDQQFFAELCNLHEDRILELGIAAEGTTYELVFGPGTLDPQTGQLAYQPDTSGIYTFEVAAFNECGADTAIITDEVVLNLPPYCLPYDTIVYLCDPEEICFDVFAVDPEGDAIVLSMLEGPGTFTQTSDTSGTACFMPGDVDHAIYSFVFYSADSCVQSHDDPNKAPMCCIDTFHVEVIITEPGDLACPGDTTIDLCVPPEEVPAEICLTGFTSTWETTEVSLGTWDGETLCFPTDGLGTYTISMYGSDTCGHADTCSMQVTLRGNEVPVLTMADDFTGEYCLPETICFAASASDPDGNIVDYDLNIGTYDTETGMVCFDVDAAGEFVVIMSVTDACGSTATDTTIVTLTPTDPPLVSLGDDLQFLFCGPQTICVPATVTSDREITVVPSMGTWDEQGMVCFLAETADVYELILTATDDCGNLAADTVLVDVQFNTPPVIEGFVDSTIALCDPGEICIPVQITDIDNDDLVITTSMGTYADGQICFMAEGSGGHSLTVTATDECDNTVSKTVVVDVTVGSAPVITGLADTSIYLCYPREICIPVEVTDIDGDIAEITTSFGTYADGQICFVPYNKGDYQIIVTATDECGHVVVDTADIEVLTDQDINLVCPNDTLIFLCEPDTLCFPIEGIPDGAEVTVGGTATYWNEETQSICFVSDCCLENTLSVSITTACGTHTCEFTVEVQTNSQPLVIMPTDTTVFLCEDGPICLPVGISDIDGNIADVTVDGGTYDDYENTVCFEPDGEGVYTISVHVIDSCGAERTDEMKVTVELNDAPELTTIFGETLISQCELEEVCIPLNIFDANDNFESIVADKPGTWTVSDHGMVDTTFCYLPDTYGEHCITFTATDDCGLTDELQVCFTIEQLATVAIECPDPAGLAVCGPGAVCFPVIITGNPSEVTTSVGWYENGQVCVHTDDLPFTEIVIIAVGDCNTDTCITQFNLEMVDSPDITCPNDTTIFLCGPETLVIPFEIAGGDGSNQMITASAPATVEFDNGWFVHVPITEAGSQTITLTHASLPCEPAECSFTVTAELNSAPTVDMNDLTVSYCELQEVCVPFWADDIDNNITDITSSFGSVILEGEGPTVALAPVKLQDRLGAQMTPPTGQVCFTPDVFGDYPITVTVTDECGEQAEVTVIATVDERSKVEITCPENPDPFTYCELGTQCIPLPITGDEFTVDASYGTWENDELCVTVEQYGLYQITVVAVSECNEDTCTFQVEFLEPVEVACTVADTTLFLCENDPATIQIPVTVTGDDAVVTVEPSGEYADGFVTVSVGDFAVNEFTVTAVNACSESSCSFTVGLAWNATPVVEAADTSVSLCELAEICVPFEATDADGNLYEIRTSLGVVRDGHVCFTPDAYGDHQITITATDDCDASSEKTITVTATEGQYVAIDCPVDQFYLWVDVPDSIRIPIAITPTDGVEITVSPDGYYDAATGELVAYVTSAGHYQFDITAEAECNTETCAVIVEVGQYVPPVVNCIGSVDTALCLTQPTTLCLPVTVTGSNVEVLVSDPAYFEDGNVCLEVTEAGNYTIDITVFNDRDTATCTSELVVTGGNPPTLVMPDDFTTRLCEPGDICFDVTIADTDFDITRLDISFGTYDAGTGRVCFFADVADDYPIEITVADGCGNSITKTTVVTVEFNDAPVVVLPDDYSTFLCELAEICVDVTITAAEDVTVTSSFGQYNADAGQICFTPDGPGTYEITVEATDDCEAVGSDTIVIEVLENTPPTISGLNDTSVYVCYPTEMCLALDVFDIDDNIQSVDVSYGTYENGQVCFVPYVAGTYEVIATVTDECGEVAVDTATVDVHTDQEVEIVCPGDTSIFLCEPETLCFPIGGIPEGATVDVGGTSTYWNEETQSICFYSDCCIDNTLEVFVTTACGTFTCSFNVHVETNAAPLVILPLDTTIIQCELGPVCLPVGISDAEDNLTDVTTSFGTYDDYRNEVCFTPDTAGVYTIGVTATDSCGAARTDYVAVTVKVNEAPIITYVPIDSVLGQCVQEEVCIPITIADGDDNIVDITVEGGTYDADLQQVCLMPDGVGHFCMTVNVLDECGLTAQEQICVDIVLGDYVQIECPEEPFAEQILCDATTLCFDLPIIGENVTVSLDYGTYENGQVCFLAENTQTYEITVIADAQCNSDTCMITVPVTILDPLAITCPEDDEQFVCQPDTFCYDFTFAPSSAEVTVSEPAYISEGQVCVPVLQTGVQTITLTVTNQCGTETCSFDVTAAFNTAPVVTLGDDVSLTECELFNICIPLTVEDADANIETLVTTQGTIDNDTAVCFTAPDYGTYSIVVTATDECGEVDADTVVVTITEGDYASIECPDGTQFASICGADTVRILAPITPSTATITILPNGVYDAETGEVAIWVTEGGTHEITIIAESQCGSDTCVFNLEVEMGIAPEVVCPGQIDTLLCLVEPDTLCFPVEVTGTGVQVNVNPAGYYAAGVACVPIDEAGEYSFEIIAFGPCGTDTCTVDINVTADRLPELFLPELLVFERCPDDSGLICIDGIYATDAESDVTITKICGLGEFTSVEGDSGMVCFLPVDFGTAEFCFEATDGCHTIVDTMTVDIQMKDDCDVCLRLSIDGGESTPVGLMKRVTLNIETNDLIGGFDILLNYDPTALSFQYATIDGGAASEWEYFTWNLDVDGDLSSHGLIRFVGIADQNNGTHHPPFEAYSPDGALLFLDFLVANDQTLGGIYVPINFLWRDCMDNSFSDRTGEILYIDSRIFNSEGILIWDEFDDASYPDVSRPMGMGAPDSCIVEDGKTLPLRCIEFYNGGVHIIHPDDIDDRGDINLNDIANEIADVVVFTNYFIRGLAAFTISIPGQIAATDVNADGLTLTVADLTMLIRIVVGDVTPIPKVVPYTDQAEVTTGITDGRLQIGAETSDGIGAAYFVFDIADDVVPGTPILTDACAGFEIGHSVIDGQLKVLLYNIGKASIEHGLNDLLSIPIDGTGEITLVHSELVDYQGRPYKSVGKSALPKNFAVMQNYPNPFNPSTTVSFLMPAPGDWSLQIFNITGALVNEYSGSGQGGQVDVVWDSHCSDGSKAASGVYFYRVDASGKSETRKMILLK